LQGNPFWETAFLPVGSAFVEHPNLVIPRPWQWVITQTLQVHRVGLAAAEDGRLNVRCQEGEPDQNPLMGIAGRLEQLTLGIGAVLSG